MTPPGTGIPIYYTLDGSDPRGDGGTFSGTLYTGPITLTTSAHIVARAYDSSNPTNLFDTRWSSPAEAVFIVGGTQAAAANSLAITEVHYHLPHRPQQRSPPDSPMPMTSSSSNS